MQENPKPTTNTASVDGSRDWQIAFELYEEDPRAALSLGFKLAMLRAYLDAETIQCRHVIEALDLGMEVFVPHTSFYSLLTYLSGSRGAN